ncbi:MAG: site-specific integrase [Planctomycetaceae bacterium]|nr:site-specific integrase [Planctomycetaceae bacterium]
MPRAAHFNFRPQTWRIGFYDGKKQVTISLGKMPKKAAQLCLSMIEQIQAANAAAQSYSVEVAHWTANIGDELHAKLVKAGLLRQRQRRTLGLFITDYIKERTDWKWRTVAAFNTSKNLMLDFFGENTPIDKITADDAVAFRLELKNEYSEATVAKIIKHCRQVFNLARCRKLITDSPFETVKLGSQRNPKRRHFVTVEEYLRLLEGCTNAKQRLLISLARFGGLRCPSELCGLRWSEIDWHEKWFWVHAPKTERYEAKEKRQVPLFPELEYRFMEFFDTLPEGCDDLIFPSESKVPPVITPKKSLTSWIEKVANRAGVELWEKPFQNCRSSRATELRKTFPEYLVNQWLGHTQEVAEEHYIQSLSGDFLDAYNAEKVVVKTVVESVGNGQKTAESGKIRTPQLTPPTPFIASTCDVIPLVASTYESSPIRSGRT